ncbi:hypothetical protein CFOL_v3_18817 [Cephalotus follicularis]|uniref:UBN2 domain-containing protein n=1 Tax=Cephalotus follicularis TaxID=3775 RepID=A0A1Q3C5G7_CEPFO|nr:hypothetical protein CFOL_v3_18817 [Cephalotus follicularis]
MPPFFDGNNFNELKIKMTCFIQSIDYDLWDVVVYDPKLSNSKVRYDENDRDFLRLNANVKHIIYCSLSSNIFENVLLCSSAKEIWNKLEECYGTSLCLMEKDASESDSDEEDSSK